MFGGIAATVPASFSTGYDSPVSIAWFTRTIARAENRPSAGTMIARDQVHHVTGHQLGDGNRR